MNDVLNNAPLQATFEYFLTKGESLMSFNIFTPTGNFTPRLTVRAFNRFVDLIKLPLETRSTLIKLPSNGIPISVISELLHSGYEWHEIEWIITKRKFQRRPSNSNLSFHESEHAIRLFKIHALAIEVMGSTEKALLWMRKPREIFDCLSAIELTKLECGTREVREALQRIDEGYF